MKKILLLLLLSSQVIVAQKAENVVLITLDGLRWQELFSGADEELINDEKYTEGIRNTKEAFWAETPEGRREKLMPFMWSYIKDKGSILGNKNLGSSVQVKNSYGFSYPGYNEIFTGYPDEKVNSNDKNYNENVTFFEFLNQQPKFKGKVAGFETWGVFPYIINDKRSGVFVNAGNGAVYDTKDAATQQLFDIQEHVKSLGSERYDFVTYFLAKNYVLQQKPKVLHIGFDETDEFAHEGKYREYLTSAHNIDGYIKDLYETMQKMPEYKDKTTFIITTDHGRGDAIKSQWTSHGQQVLDCKDIWIAAFGPGIEVVQEAANTEPQFQNQIAATIAHLLGYTYTNGHEIGEVLQIAK